MNSKHLFIALALCSSVWQASALAETANTVHLGNERVSKEQVIDLLSPKNEFGELRTRGIRLKNQPENASVEAPAPRGLSLEVYFDFDSAQLTEIAKQQLYPVGEALQSNELASLSFTLEGHTDAIGDDNYNHSLSEQRALAVMQFFVDEFSLAPDRILAQGKGEAELLDQENPGSGINRRVSIIAQ